MKQENLDRDESDSDDSDDSLSGSGGHSKSESSQSEAEEAEVANRSAPSPKRARLEPPRRAQPPQNAPASQARRGGRQNFRKANDLDPMDPASYSENCPRGKWSDGLETKGDVPEPANE